MELYKQNTIYPGVVMHFSGSMCYEKSCYKPLKKQIVLYVLEILWLTHQDVGSVVVEVVLIP